MHGPGKAQRGRLSGNQELMVNDDTECAVTEMNDVSLSKVLHVTGMSGLCIKPWQLAQMLER